MLFSQLLIWLGTVAYMGFAYRNRTFSFKPYLCRTNRYRSRNRTLPTLPAS
jgi:hypothetical protein